MKFIHRMVDFQPSYGYNSTMIERNIFPFLLAALEDTPVVLITGARQTGKSTLVAQIHEDDAKPRKYISLDDIGTLAAAKNDPEGFIRSLEGPVIIDEIQRAPELLLPIKVSVDTNRVPGRYILTGSANILLLPKISESLAGRMEIIPLYPFSQSEIAKVKYSFPDFLYQGDTLQPYMTIPPPPTATVLKEMLMRGGYPEIQLRDSEIRQRAWFNSYIKTLIEKDIKDFANIENPSEIFRLLALLAAHSGGLSHYAELSRALEIPQTTLKRYFSLLRAANLVQIIPAWSNNFGKKIVRSPKILLADTGLISYFLGINLERFEVDPILYGRLFECFVILELLKQCSWSAMNAQYYHYRSSTGEEIDFLLEYPGGEVIGIEIKARATVSANDFKWLKSFQESYSNRFLKGLVLYTGDKIIPFGNNLFAVPIHLLWNYSI